jgi:dTDP-4-dehydrorhamnose 3,5-epimerase
MDKGEQAVNRFAFTPLKLEGAFLIDCFYAGDARGGLTKSYEKQQFEMAGISFQLHETFFSRSDKNVIRGLHFQLYRPQAKLVTVIKGSAWDVIVDLRRDSVTYKKWVSVELTEDSHRSVYVPRGFGHGFLSLADDTVMLYQCDGAYDKDTDSGIRYDDPQIGIRWPVDKNASIHSDRDLHLPYLRVYEKQDKEVT